MWKKNGLDLGFGFVSFLLIVKQVCLTNVNKKINRFVQPQTPGLM
jgi:hypothetical protein